MIVTLGQAVADPEAVSVHDDHDRQLSTTGRQRMLHWDLPDLDLRKPTEDAVRTVLNTLDRRALTLLADLLTADEAAVDQTQPA